MHRSRNLNSVSVIESLERKMTLSGVAIAPVAAEVCVPTAQAGTRTQAPTVVYLDSNVIASAADDDGDDDGDGRVSITCDSPDPNVPTGGTDPAPPDGDGSIPPSTPSIPGGPDVPA